jgi:rubredoxin
MDLKVQRPQKPGGNTLTGGLNSPLVAQNDIGKMKEEFKKIDAALLFDANFYPNAAVFMRDNSLDYDYLSWVYTTVKARKDVRNVRDYYFRIFTKPEMPELYKTQKEKEKQDAEANEKKRIKNTITCPACSTQFDRDTQNCPECGLAQNDFADNAKVARQIKIIRLSPEQYRERKDEIDKAYRDFHSPAEYADRIKRLSAINNKYGISGDS